MDEGDIRMLARVESLVAERCAVVASIEAMKAENAAREAKGEAQAWPYGMFDDARKQLEGIVAVLQRM